MGLKSFSEDLQFMALQHATNTPADMRTPLLRSSLLALTRRKLVVPMPVRHYRATMSITTNLTWFGLIFSPFISDSLRELKLICYYSKLNNSQSD